MMPYPDRVTPLHGCNILTQDRRTSRARKVIISLDRYGGIQVTEDPTGVHLACGKPVLGHSACT